MACCPSYNSSVIRALTQHMGDPNSINFLASEVSNPYLSWGLPNCQIIANLWWEGAMFSHAVLEQLHWPLKGDSVGLGETAKEVRITQQSSWGFCPRTHASLFPFWDYLHGLHEGSFFPLAHQPEEWWVAFKSSIFCGWITIVFCPDLFCSPTCKKCN